MLSGLYSMRAGLFLLAATVVDATLQIVPGATWTATNTGEHIQAHGAGIIEVSGTYYMIGEDHTNGSAFQNINCYSSTNLVEWTYVGALLSQTSSGDLGPNRVVERPKVIYNSANKQYVLWMHIDDSGYSEAKVGVATSSSVCGTYSYKGSWQPLGFQSRDMGLFQDTDGSAYLLTEDRANGLRIDALNSDYTNVTKATYLYSEDYEAPAMIKIGSTYYMFASHESGWDPNDNIYSTATNIAGPWSAWNTFATAGSDTYDSQTNFILPLGNSGAIYLGDRWVSTDLGASTYVWLPLSISGTSVSMNNYVNWVPNVSAGTWAAGPSETTPEAEAATLAGSAVVMSCSGCSGGKDVGYIGGPSPAGSVEFTGVTSDATTTTSIRIKYLNGDSSPRYATVTVNGVSQKIAFLPVSGGSPSSSVLNANLNSGSANTVTITTTDGTYGPDVDRIMVPVS
ncbi:galactan 1,3-beta-galactosidase [Xylariaceae sp. FL0255]|nr:galactan 1,3-beta-galactosidase [Xylariaceae sp. FL0255]